MNPQPKYQLSVIGCGLAAAGLAVLVGAFRPKARARWGRYGERFPMSRPSHLLWGVALGFLGAAAVTYGLGRPWPGRLVAPAVLSLLAALLVMGWRDRKASRGEQGGEPPAAGPP